MNGKMINPDAQLIEQIKKNGGYVNCLTYPFRAYTITQDHLTQKVNLGMKYKAPTALNILESLSQKQIKFNIFKLVEVMYEQNCKTLACCVDLHPNINPNFLEIIKDLKNFFRENQKTTIKLIGHPLASTKDLEMAQLYRQVAGELDILGSALFREDSNLIEHLEFMHELSEKNYGKRIQLQVDQSNSPTEQETLLLVKYMKKDPVKWKGRVYITFATSTGCLNNFLQRNLYDDMYDLGINVVVCPSAQLATKWNDNLQPGKNSIINLPLMLSHGLTVGLGTANISDVHQPFLTGDMKREILTLAEASRYYDIEMLAKIASINGGLIIN